MAKPGPVGHLGYNGSYSGHFGSDFTEDPQSQILIPLLSLPSYVILVEYPVLSGPQIPPLSDGGN